MPSLQRLRQIVVDEAYRLIKVNDGDRQISMSVAQAAIRSLALSAARGQQRSQKLLSELLQGSEASIRADRDAWLEEAIKYKLNWEQQIKQCEELGITPPDPVPHPEDIIIDFANNHVEIRGPMTEEAKSYFHAAWSVFMQLDNEISDIREQLETRRSARSALRLQGQIDKKMSLRNRIVAKFGEPPKRFRTEPRRKGRLREK